MLCKHNVCCIIMNTWHTANSFHFQHLPKDEGVSKDRMRSRVYRTKISAWNASIQLVFFSRFSSASTCKSVFLSQASQHASWPELGHNQSDLKIELAMSSFRRREILVFQDHLHRNQSIMGLYRQFYQQTTPPPKKKKKKEKKERHKSLFLFQKAHTEASPWGVVSHI